MSVFKKMFGVGAAVVLGALALGPASAFAAEDNAVCGFEGLAGALNPPIPAATHDPGLQNTIETGSYHFTGPGVCVKVDSAETGNSSDYAVSITSDGTYANQVCGTGTADGTNLASTQVTSP